MHFEWDEEKNEINQQKHSIGFEEAQYAFADPQRIVAKDESHSTITEDRFFCYGKIGSMIATVRFTHRKNKIRIIGAGYWREGKKIYEQANKI